MKPASIYLAPDLSVPLDIVTETLSVLGRRGSGKTSTATVLAEEFISAGQQVVIIDPLDVWHGLRSTADGKPGYPVVVFGGLHGDLELDGATGKDVADAILESGFSAVLSLRLMSNAEARRFVGDFCARLYERKGEEKYRRPLHLIIDEADSFVPQRPQPEGMKAYGAIDTIVRRGRSSGFGTTLISQRAAVLAKDVLTQTEILVCHQTTGPQDRKALEAWVEQHDDQNHRKEFLESLASLRVGEAWFWSPAKLGLFQRVRVRARTTFDSSSTPKVGESRVVPYARVSVDIGELRARLASAPKKGDKKAAAAPSGEVEALREELRAMTELLARANAQVDRSTRFLERLRDLFEEMITECDADIATHTTKPPTPEPAPKERPKRDTRRDAPQTWEAYSGLTLGPAVILGAIIQHGKAGCTREQLTVLTGYKRSSRDTYLQKLKAAELVTQTGEAFVATEKGRNSCPDTKPLPRGKALLEHWLTKLPAGEAAVLRVIAKSRGAVTRETITAETEYRRSSRDTYIQKLKARRLVVQSGNDLRLNDELR